MWSKPQNVLALVTVWLLVEASGQKQERTITECDKEIGKILCDNFQPEMCTCADKMPSEEHPFFYECASENSLVDTDNWKALLEAVCSHSEPVKTAFSMIDCWDQKMEKAVENMENKVYPVDHFQCKKDIFKDALKKAKCPCRMEKQFPCDLPTNSFG